MQGERKVGKARLPRVLAVYGNRVLAVENAGSNRTRQLSFARLGDFAFALIANACGLDAAAIGTYHTQFVSSHFRGLL